MQSASNLLVDHSVRFLWLCPTVFGEICLQRTKRLCSILFWAPGSFESQRRKDRGAMFDRTEGRIVVIHSWKQNIPYCDIAFLFLIQSHLHFPCWQAAKSKKPIEVCVALLDDRTVDLHLDSASTSAEVCEALADKINLRDTCGFSLCITLYNKVGFIYAPLSRLLHLFSHALIAPHAEPLNQFWIQELNVGEKLFCGRQVASLGSCGNHVLDAVSQCEQEMQRQGKKEKDTPWRLSFRKELFTPWHDCSVDPVSTDLIYRQIIKGIKSGEYTFEKVRLRF